MNNSIEEFKEQLRKVGLRITPARLVILTLLQNHSKPLEVRSVLRLLKASAPDQATVYRALSSLTTCGLVKAITLKSGIVSYEIANLPHHHHLICERCGYVEDVETCCESPRPRVASFTIVNDHRLEFSGICNNCA
ncbi:MAG: transcriptional repressor [Candidatus Andersenbacteria bacterium]|nr:transcriptional repressor [Candidatus Andersenbacteria bacterium]MBI3251230.1 transcriptional repressor [Candidatus Andersenbacteria bacterium]